MAELTVTNGGGQSATDSVSITVEDGVDLSISFFPFFESNPPVGSRVDLLVDVRNEGPAVATGVKVHLPFPDGYASPVISSGGPGAYDPATGDWTIATVGVRAFGRFVFTGMVLPSGSYDVTATASADQPDTNAANNSLTFPVAPNVNADLGISFFSPPAGTLTPGNGVTLFVEVNNSGPSTTTGVTALFRVPAGYAVTNGGPQHGTYDGTTGVWTIGTMVSRSLARLILDATVSPTGSTALQATITHSDQPDPNLANNAVSPPPINRPPVADAGVDRTAPTHASVGLSGALSFDADGDPVTFQWTLAVKPANSAATLSGANTATPSFTPDKGGVYAVQLIVRDTQNVVSAPDVVVVTAVVQNQQPTIRSTAVTAAAAGQAYSYDVEATDPDAGDVLTFSLPTAPAGMAINPATGLIQWTPLNGQGGPQAVAVRVQDAAGLFDVQNFTVQVSTASAHAPVAHDDAYEAHVGESLGVGAAGVLGNDIDADGSPLTATLVSAPKNGSLNLSGDGSFLYTPHVLQANGMLHLDGINLATRVPGVVAEASSSRLPVSAVIDGTLGTTWEVFSDRQPRVDIAFPQDVTVARLELVGKPTVPISAGVFQLLAADDTVLFDTSGVDIPAPLFNVTVEVPNVSGVRRVRFLATAKPSGLPFTAFDAGLDELRVIGSADITRPPAVLETNLAQLLPTSVSASGFFSLHHPESVIDGSTTSNWYAPSAEAGEFIELKFPVNTTVTRIVAANPQNLPEGFFSSGFIACSGTFQLLSDNGAVLFDSGVVNEPSGFVAGSDQFTLEVPSVGGVRRVRYTAAGCLGGSIAQTGFSEISVLGSAPVTAEPLTLFRKFNVLAGREIHSTPLVANLTDDDGNGRVDLEDTPDILVLVESVGNQLTGEIKVMSGDDGRELRTMGAPNLVSPWSEAAVGDIDGDGLPEIIAVHSDGNHLIAFEHTGEVKWTSDANAMPRFLSARTRLRCLAAPSRSRTSTELARPRSWWAPRCSTPRADCIGDGRTLGGTTGGVGLRSAISAIADLDLDGKPEIVAGPTAYRVVNGALTVVWRRADRPDGYVAVGNLTTTRSRDRHRRRRPGLHVESRRHRRRGVERRRSHGPVSDPGSRRRRSPHHRRPEWRRHPRDRRRGDGLLHRVQPRRDRAMAERHQGHELPLDGLDSLRLRFGRSASRSSTVTSNSCVSTAAATACSWRK